ncbi:hypothetical protein FD45_GL001428 [Liquorilactobacillus nagelii DSM 13675]|nr:hypothetical protein FD45_GL001428 [Liquorilactobacillus nagelii DSM 13675]
MTANVLVTSPAANVIVAEPAATKLTVKLPSLFLATVAIDVSLDVAAISPEAPSGVSVAGYLFSSSNSTAHCLL